MPKDPGRAAVLFQKTCDARSLGACTTLALQYRNGEGIPKNLERATSLFQKACDGGQADGCLYLAWQYAKGDGVPPSGTMAAARYHQAGLAFLKAKQKEDALRCVERIRSLAGLGLAVPNAFLADELVKAIHGTEHPGR